MLRTFLAIFPIIGTTSTVSALELCEGTNRAENNATCLVDGDTGWENGIKWRSKGWDTPEIGSRAKCDAESSLAKQATERAQELLSNDYTIIWHLEKDIFDRRLVNIKLSTGEMLGDVLILEGLAVPWPHKKGIWCPISE